MATLSNYISLSTNIPSAMNKAANATQTAYQKMDTLHAKMTGVSNASTTLKASVGGIMNSFAGNMLANYVMRGVDAITNAVASIQETAQEWASVQARMKLVAGSQENAIYLNNEIFKSAQRARGGYLEMAEAVAQIATSAHDAFPDPREAVTFMEGIQKVFAIGGASKESQKFAMLQLTQALASGQLQGDEFRSIAENAPMIENIIAKSMGVSRGELKKLASQGEITADVIKNAIMRSMPEIEAQFAQMPKTWGDHMQSIKNIAIKEFEPVFQRISDLANSDVVRTLSDNIVNAITFVAPIFYWLVGVVETAMNTVAWVFTSVFTFIQQHSFILKSALIVLAGVMAYFGIQTLIAAVNTGIATVAMVAKTVADWAETAAILALIVAQEGLNAALYACPLTWIIGLIVAVILVFYAAVEAVNYFAGTSISATGVIAGVFGWMGGVIVNMFSFVWNMIASFVNFYANVFNDPLHAVANLFIDIWNGIVEYVKVAVNNIIDMINAIPGMSKVLGGKVNYVGSDWSFSRYDISGGENVIMERREYNNLTNDFNYAYDWGQNLGLPNINMPETPKIDTFNPNTIEQPLARDTADNTGKTAKEAKRTADSISMTNDEIKALRDSAIDKTLKQWQDANIINIEMNNDVTINDDTDLDGFTSKIVKGIAEAHKTKREGM